MQTSLIICLAVFLVLLILIEKLSSIKTIIRIALSLGIIWLYIKFITDGKSIGITSLLVGIALVVVNVVIKSGINRKSFSEILSVLIVSIATGGIVWLICRRVGFQDEVMRFNGVRSPNGVMFGIYIIATLGIFMDIISRMIYHLDDERDKTVDVTWRNEFKIGIEIGRKYIAEKINMIIFMVLSVSLFPICASVNNDKSFYEIIGETEIFKYLLILVVASIGILLSVIITSGVYAFLNKRKTIYKTVSDNKLDGKRSLKL